MIGRRGLTAGLVLALGGLSNTAHAGAPPWGYTPDRVLFTWVGRVDRELVLSMRGPALREGGIDGWLPSRARVVAPLPRTNGLVLVRIDDGRGYVDVIEQPNAWNGYTALIRILDPRGGADGYRLTVYWDRDARGSGRRAPVWDPRWDDRRGYDPRWDRRDDRDGRYDPRYDELRGDPRDDRRDDPRTDPRANDRRGYDPRRDPRRDPGFVTEPERPAGRGDTAPTPARQAKPRQPERRGRPLLRAPDQPPDSAGIPMETR